MKKALFFCFLIVLIIDSFAQTWTEPIQISTLQGINRNPDFFIDNSGIIHCVWSYKVTTDYWHIYYSKSTDDGLSWSIPENVSQNTNLWMENPHIVADSENNLHLTYDYQSDNSYQTLIVYRKFSGNTWSEMDTVSVGWPGARHNRLVIDHNNKLYCFWFHDFQNGTTFYRVLENGVWGDILVPYNNNDLVFFMKGVVDNLNNIYCTGSHHYYGQSGYDDRIISFNYINGLWINYNQLSDNTSWGGNDIALSSSDYPVIVWRQYINNSIPPDDGTLFSFYEGEDWSIPELIAEDADEQAICVDINNQIHIVDNEEYENGYRLVHYQIIDNEWVGEIIEEDDYGNYGNKLTNGDDYLYLVSAKAYSSSPEPDIPIVLRKYEITTGIENKPIFIESYIIYPNPSRANTTISYSIKETKYTSIKIYDLQGKLINTLIEKKQIPGRYEIIWNGTDKNKKEVISGLYFIRLQAGRQFITRSVEIIK
jgi:hypothetical protein